MTDQITPHTTSAAVQLANNLRGIDARSSWANDKLTKAADELERLDALAASAPVAPTSVDVDELAQFIRETDGSNSMGAGVLAEKILGWLEISKAAPVAPVAPTKPGFVLVPAVPTEEMMRAGYDAYDVADCYGAMLDAAPKAAPAAPAPQPVPPEWLSDQYGGDFDDMTAGQGYRKGWNDCRSRMLAPAPKAEPADHEHLLGNLLARIHGDGGHYATEHGLAKAAEDAELLVSKWRAAPLQQGEYLPLPKPVARIDCSDSSDGHMSWWGELVEDTSHTSVHIGQRLFTEQQVREAIDAHLAARDRDGEWRQAALDACFPTEACFDGGNPRQTIENLIDWHLQNERFHVAQRGAAPPTLICERAELQRLADCCPELNEHNYNQGDVEELNAWAVEVEQFIRRALATPPAPSAQDADPLQGAADWLVGCGVATSPADIGELLSTGYNRASRLFDAARAQQEGGEPA